MCILLPPGCSLDRKLICNLDSIKMKREQSSLRHLIEHFILEGEQSRGRSRAAVAVSHPRRQRRPWRRPSFERQGWIHITVAARPTSSVGRFCLLLLVPMCTSRRLIGLAACRSLRPCPAGAVLCPCNNMRRHAAASGEGVERG